MIAKRKHQMEEEDEEGEQKSPASHHIIRDLRGTASQDKLLHRGHSPSEVSKAGGFMNVIEHHEEEESDNADMLQLNVDNDQANKVISDIHKARSKMHRKSV